MLFRNFISLYISFIFSFMTSKLDLFFSIKMKLEGAWISRIPYIFSNYFFFEFMLAYAGCSYSGEEFVIWVESEEMGLFFRLSPFFWLSSFRSFVEFTITILLLKFEANVDLWFYESFLRESLSSEKLLSSLSEFFLILALSLSFSLFYNNYINYFDSQVDQVLAIISGKIYQVFHQIINDIMLIYTKLYICRSQ